MNEQPENDFFLFLSNETCYRNLQLLKNFLTLSTFGFGVASISTWTYLATKFTAAPKVLHPVITQKAVGLLANHTGVVNSSIPLVFDFSHLHPLSPVGFGMGTEKPVVFPKRVIRVWVRCVTLAHRGIPRTRTRSYGYFTGMLQQVSIIFIALKLIFSCF